MVTRRLPKESAAKASVVPTRRLPRAGRCADKKAAEGKCGGDKKAAEGKCGGDKKPGSSD